MTESIIQHIENMKQPYRVPVFTIKPSTIHFSDKVEKRASVLRLTTCDFITDYYNVSYSNNCLRWIRIPEYDSNDLLTSQFGKTPENPYFKTHNNNIITPILCKLYITPGAYENIVDIFSEINSKLYDSFVDLFKIHTNPTSVYVNQQFKYQYSPNEINPGDADIPSEKFIPSIFTKWGDVQLNNSVVQNTTLTSATTNKIYYYVPGTIRYEKDNIQYTLKNSFIAFTTTTLSDCSLINSTIKLPYFNTIDDENTTESTTTTGNTFNVVYLNQMYNIFESSFSSLIVTESVEFRNAYCNIFKNGVIGDVEGIRCQIWNNGKEVVSNVNNINIESATLSNFEDVSELSKFKDRFTYQVDTNNAMGQFIYRYANDDIIMNEDLTITLTIPSAVITETETSGTYTISLSENTNLTIFNTSGTNPIVLDGFVSTCALFNKYPNCWVLGNWITRDEDKAPVITFTNEGTGKIPSDGKPLKVEIQLKGSYDDYAVIGESTTTTLPTVKYLGTRTITTTTSTRQIDSSEAISSKKREYKRIENNLVDNVEKITYLSYVIELSGGSIIETTINKPTTVSREVYESTINASDPGPDVPNVGFIVERLTITTNTPNETNDMLTTVKTVIESIYGPPPNNESAELPSNNNANVSEFQSLRTTEQVKVSDKVGGRWTITTTQTSTRLIHEQDDGNDGNADDTNKPVSINYNSIPTSETNETVEPVNPSPGQQQTTKSITTTKEATTLINDTQTVSGNETIRIQTYQLYHHESTQSVMTLSGLVKSGYAVRVKKYKYENEDVEINEVVGVDILPVRQSPEDDKWYLDVNSENVHFTSFTATRAGTNRPTTYYNLNGSIERIKNIDNDNILIDYPVIDRKFTISSGDCSAGLLSTVPAFGTSLSNLFVLNDATSVVKEVRTINENISITYDSYYYKAYRLIMEKQSEANFISLITADENNKLAVKFFSSVIPITSPTIYTSTVDFLNVLQDPNFNLKFNTLHLEPIIEYDDATGQMSIINNNFKLSKYSQQNNNVDDFYYNFAISKNDLWAKLGFVPNVIEYDKTTVMSYNSKNKADESDSVEQVYPIYTVKGVYYSETLYNGPIYTSSPIKLESYEQNLNTTSIRKILLPEHYNIMKLLSSSNNATLFNTYFNKTTHYAQRLMNLGIPKTIEVKMTQNKDIEEYLNSNEVVDSIANIGQYQVVRDNQSTISSIQQQLTINTTIEIPDEKTLYVFLTNGNQIYSLMDTVATLNVEYIN